jgi:hypothetical protein
MCWDCGGRVEGTINVGATHKRSRENFLHDISGEEEHRVRKGEEPAETPAPDPLEEEEAGQDSTPSPDDEEDPGPKEEIHPIYRALGRILGWIGKWRDLLKTHMRSMAMVVATVAGFWSLSLVYGAARFGASGFTALVGASLIAIMSAGLATLFYLSPSRRNTELLAFPFAFTTIFLPPTVIALYEPQLSGLLWQSRLFAEFLLTHVFSIIGLEQFLRTQFSLRGETHLIMWFILSFPFGWAAAGINRLRR